MCREGRGLYVIVRSSRRGGGRSLSYQHVYSVYTIPPSQPPAAMFVSISVAVAAVAAETDADAAGGAEFCVVAVGLAGRTAMLAGTGDAAEAAAVPGPATLLATVEDAIRLFAGSPLLAALAVVATPGPVVRVVLLLALELLLLLPTEGGAGDGDSEHESGEDSDDDEDDDDILLVLLTAAAAAAATIW